MPRKAQTEVITIVLLSGIVIALVGTAYMWGAPLIAKRSAVTEFLSAEDFVVRLDSKITEIANSGSGEASLAFSKGTIEVIPYGDADIRNNSIIYEYPIGQPLVMGNSVILKTNVLGENATYGEAEPRIINLSAMSAGSDYKLIFNTHYRELDTRNPPYKGYLIALEKGSVTGYSQIIVSHAGTSVIHDGRADKDKNGDLILTKIRIDLI